MNRTKKIYIICDSSYREPGILPLIAIFSVGSEVEEEDVQFLSSKKS